MNRINTGFVSDPLVKQPFTVKSLDFLQDTNKDMLVGMAQSIVGENYSLSTPYILKGLDAYGSNQYNVGYILYNGEVYYSSGKANTTPFTNIAVMTIATSSHPTADPLKFTDTNYHNVHDIIQMNLSDALTGTGTFDLLDAIYIQNFNLGEVLLAQTSTSTIYCPDSNNNDSESSYEIDFESQTYTDIKLLNGPTDFKTGSIINLKARSIKEHDYTSTFIIIQGFGGNISCSTGDRLLFYGIYNTPPLYQVSISLTGNVLNPFFPIVQFETSPDSQSIIYFQGGTTPYYLIGDYTIIGNEAGYNIDDFSTPITSGSITIVNNKSVTYGLTTNIDCKIGDNISFYANTIDTFQIWIYGSYGGLITVPPASPLPYFLASYPITQIVGGFTILNTTTGNPWPPGPPGTGTITKYSRPLLKFGGFSAITDYTDDVDNSLFIHKNDTIKLVKTQNRWSLLSMLQTNKESELATNSWNRVFVYNGTGINGKYYPTDVFYRKENSCVYLMGCFSSGESPNYTEFQLPVGYRPINDLFLKAMLSDGTRISIIIFSSSGLFTYTGGSGANFIDLKGISFKTE